LGQSGREAPQFGRQRIGLTSKNHNSSNLLLTDHIDVSHRRVKDRITVVTSKFPSARC
jgi:hypothetical protein